MTKLQSSIRLPTITELFHRKLEPLCKAGISQDVLAKMCGINRVTMNKIFNQKQKVSAEVLFKCGAFFKWNMNDFKLCAGVDDDQAAI